ncbi:MAG: nucleotidyltransferase [Lautropia sp.]
MDADDGRGEADSQDGDEDGNEDDGGRGEKGGIEVLPDRSSVLQQGTRLAKPCIMAAPNFAPEQSDAPAIYARALRALEAAGSPFLLGGAWAFAYHTGIERTTKDLDLVIRRSDFASVAAVLEAAGFETALTYPHWLGKARNGEVFIDLIFNSGNGMTAVDDEWFRGNGRTDVLGVAVDVVPVEELIWSKSFVMERERFDGAEVLHLLRDCAAHLDWERLLRRFGGHWRVLLAHLVLFGYVYPDEQLRLPESLLVRLIERFDTERWLLQGGHLADAGSGAGSERVCRGTMLSREQYLHDVERDGYRDARRLPPATMSARELEIWTRAIGQPESSPGTVRTRA